MVSSPSHIYLVTGGTVVKNPLASAEDARHPGLIPGSGDPLEEGMATHSSILSWRTPWTEEPGGLQSMGSQRVGHNWAHTHTHKVWSRKTGLRRLQRRSDTWEESWKMNFTGQRHRKWEGQAGRETNICAKILQSPWHIWGNWNIAVSILKSLTEHFGLYPTGTWDKLLSWERMLDI